MRVSSDKFCLDHEVLVYNGGKVGHASNLRPSCSFEKDGLTKCPSFALLSQFFVTTNALLYVCLIVILHTR